MRYQSTVIRLCRSVFLTLLVLVALALDALTAGAQVAAQKYALMVGVTIYDHAAMNGSEPLKFPEADAKAVGKMLKDHGYEVEYLLGPQATREAILKKLESLNNKGNSTGICVVGFFGHGVEVELKDAEGKKDIQGCFCPFETTVRQAIDADGSKQFADNGQPKVEPNPESLVKMSEVVNSLALAKAGSRMLIADCCRDMPNRARGRNLGLGANFNTDRLPGQTVMLFGCRPGERALERDDWEHGAFTKALLEELTNMVSGRDPVTSGTLADRVKRRVQQLTSNQQNPTPISLDSIDLLLDQSSGEMSIVGTVAGEVHEWVPNLGMKFAWCPPGVFTMGSPAGEVGRDENEVQRTVRLSQGFWMSQTEVTRGQFSRFVSATGYVTEAERDGKGGYGIDSEGNFAQKPEYTWRNAGFSQTDAHPVVNVSWNDAVAFCEWLSKEEGRRYRLPTEAEWEYACRASSTTAYHNGNDPEGLTKVGNVGDASLKARYSNSSTVSSSDGYVYTSPVGIFGVNRWNLYDMHGNVLEWCSDWYGEYSASDVLDPKGASTGSDRVCRGGGWDYQASYCRSADRGRLDPSFRYYDLGFRLLLSPSVK